ncbi:hypothetical protein [Undibacterium macrobrachii]|uniref:Morphogenetic protein n=1 Tax=Undibacterium macrobrachii TaxID=1119058 RepID=A0ABQ2X671_9BURK|nr:hypothetical protein [Undibacterium macrobrachii]GGX01649.1 hypothetical protein GCM10011282_04490 [Undibacterium macrobrachii]
MKQRPILFSAPMVRALLDGTKTQTRRIAHSDSTEMLRPSPFVKSGIETIHGYEVKNPYGNQGDQLWVRETYGIEVRSYGGGTGEFYAYRATKPDAVYCKEASGTTIPIKWIPSIHMPRKACRITLEITSIRVERLQDISKEDAITEGLSTISKDGKTWKYGIPDRDGLPGRDNDGWPWSDWEEDPRLAYKKLWERINGTGSWDANPWVWVIEFKRVEQ